MSTSGPSLGYVAAPGFVAPPVDPASYGEATYQQGQGWAPDAAAQGMFSPSFGPQRRYRRTTGDDGSALEPGTGGLLGVNPIYQHPSGSAPSLDVAANAPISRGPPLADDLGSSMDKLSIGGGAPARSTTPAGTQRGPNPAVDRANALYAQQEIYQSAAEVQPENSLAAIAHEVDQTASDIKQSADRGQTVLGPAVAQYPGAASEQSPMAPAFDPAYGAGQPPAPAGEWPPQDPSQAGYAASYTDGQSGYYAQDAYGAYAAQQSYAPAHHQANGYFNAQGGYGYDAAYYAQQQGYVDYGAAGSSAAGAAGYLGYGQEIHRPPSAASGYMVPPMGLNRQHTQLSMTSANNAASAARRKSKESAAIQQTLPYNKHFVDEYRQRMKGDPDPEAQFAFAKYLIEAAKKVSDPKDGPKQARKYRDNLLSESLKLVKRLATTGTGLGKPPYAEAQFFLANCFGNGSLGLQVDHEKAYNLYVQASKQNHPAATYRTAVCNEVGAGTRRDHHRAVLFYRKASALGDTAGMYKLGMILLNGLLGQPRNIREAIVWLKRAAGQADEDNPHALHELGLLHEKPNNSVVMHDEAYARELFTQAAQLGYAPSQFKLGSAYEYGSLTCPVDPRRSIAWYTKAAGKGDGESELALSGWYLTGSEGVLKQSDSEAYLWARRAATKGIPKAEYALGYYTEVGIGVQSNIDEAKRWYMRAAAQGNKRAMQRLTELKKMGSKAGRKGARPTRKDAETECVVM